MSYSSPSQPYHPPPPYKEEEEGGITIKVSDAVGECDLGGGMNCDVDDVWAVGFL